MICITGSEYPLGLRQQFELQIISWSGLVTISESKELGAGGCYLSESLAITLAILLSEQHQLLALLIPLMDFIKAGQQADQQHEGDKAQQGENGYRQWRQLIG